MDYNNKRTLSRANSSPNSSTAHNHPKQGDIPRPSGKTGSLNEALHVHRSPSTTLTNSRSPSSTLQRMASYDQTYSPARTPSASTRLSKPRANSGSRSFQNAQFVSQEKSYLKKIKNDMADDYYTKAIISDPTESEEDESGLEEFEDGDDDQDFFVTRGSAKGASLEMDHFDPSVLDTDRDNPKILERLEWQTMLSLVLNGDVVRSEKRRIIKQTDFLQSTYKDNLWLGIKAYILGRSEEQQRKIIEYNRSKADDTIVEIVKFKVQNRDNAVSEVREILDKFDSVKELWRDEKEMANEKPICASDEFVDKIEALISWKNITKTLERELKVLEQWTQSKNLSLTQVRNDGFVDTSFADSMLKEKEIPTIFQKRLFGPHVPWFNKSKLAYLTFNDYFEDLNLPSYIPSLSRLYIFPMRLIQETIKIRLAYAIKLTSPTMMMIDEMIDDFSLYVMLAIQIKQAHIDYMKGWDIELDVPEGFDSVILEAVQYLFSLLHRKMINTTTKSFRTFKEPDDLDACWQVLKNIGCFIDKAGPEVAFQISSLTAKLVQRMNTFLSNHLVALDGIQKDNDLTVEQKSQEVTSWASSGVDKINLLRRKLNKFYNSIRKALFNSALFSLNKVGPFLEIMKNTDHFLVQTGKSAGIYILASSNLYGRDDMILEILSGKEIGSDLVKPKSSIIDINLDDYEEENEVGYLVVIHAAKPMLWEGSIVSIRSDVAENFDIKPGELLLITQGSSQTLKQTRTIFSDCVGDIVSLVQFRASLPRVNKELVRIEKLFYKCVILQLSSVTRCRSIICKINKQHESIYIAYSFVKDSAKNYIRTVDGIKRTVIIKRMIDIALDWVSYIVDDCIPTDKKTFRWCVAALEFAMEVSKGFNILTLTDAQFNTLKDKVAGCMSLLISHFDIMGARSSEAEKQTISTIPANIQDDQAIIRLFKERTMKKLEAMETSIVQAHSVGKVLDDTMQENQYLSFLASSFSSLSMRWQKRKFLGGGSFGTVFSALNLDTGGVLAVKEIRFHDIQSIKQVVPQIKEEMTVLEMLNHPNIVQYYGVEVHRDKVNIFMEFCEGGSLASLLEHGRIEDETVIQMYTLQLFEGLAYLHDMGIVHRDVKPENILLDHNGIIKFVDFGAAKVIAKNATKKAATKVNSMTGTPMYMSPEVITGSYSSKYSVDVWATGCCLLEMATGRRPWANLDNEWAIMYHIAAGHLPQLPTKDQLSESGLKFLVRCLERDPNKRPSALKLLDDPWLVDIRILAFGESSSSSEVSSDFGG